MNVHSASLSNLHFQVGRNDEAYELIVKYHYSKRIPANVQFIGTLHEGGGLFGDSGNPVAALCFSIPPTRWSLPVWELSRLVRREECEGIPLTNLISQSCQRVKDRIDLVISFADWTHGHHGGVYQAASWLYSGKRKRRMDGLIIDGKFVPGRSCNSTWGTSSPSLLADKLRHSEIVPHYDEGKHLYWRALNKTGRKKAEALGLESLPYPKPETGD